MEDELDTDPGHPAANYWLTAAARGSGNLERAWHAAVAGWVRAQLRPESATTLRQDLDRFVTTVLIPERARLRPAREQAGALTDLQAQWDAVKDHWK
jgi:phage terminase Nu1 subunit (DNA packaging protein)